MQFVTGDPEYDALEKRISDGTIDDAEIDKILSDWEGAGKKAVKETSAVVDSVGDGFNDEYGVR